MRDVLRVSTIPPARLFVATSLLRNADRSRIAHPQCTLAISSRALCLLAFCVENKSGPKRRGDIASVDNVRRHAGAMDDSQHAATAHLRDHRRHGWQKPHDGKL